MTTLERIEELRQIRELMRSSEFRGAHSRSDTVARLAALLAFDPEFQNAAEYYGELICRPRMSSTFYDTQLAGLDRLTGQVIAQLQIQHKTDARTEQIASSAQPSINPKRVFVVHGHDNEAKLACARFLERVGLEPIILHEQASRGMTIIEKLEAHSDVCFAIVLLTPDDVGAAAAEQSQLNPRARQNVILELGYMMAKLGRPNVCTLVRPGIERPSDYDGVVYVDMDLNEGWHLQVAKELRAAGLPIDFHKL